MIEDSFQNTYRDAELEACLKWGCPSVVLHVSHVTYWTRLSAQLVLVI